MTPWLFLFLQTYPLNIYTETEPTVRGRAGHGADEESLGSATFNLHLTSSLLHETYSLLQVTSMLLFVTSSLLHEIQLIAGKILVIVCNIQFIARNIHFIVYVTDMLKHVTQCMLPCMGKWKRARQNVTYVVCYLSCLLMGLIQFLLYDRLVYTTQSCI